MTARKPAKIKLLGKTVTVAWHPATPLPGRQDQAVGQYGSRDGQIDLLEAGISRSELNDTLLHEVLHACLAEAGLSIDLLAKKGREETLVRRVTPILLAVLRDNPQLLAFLLEKT